MSAGRKIYESALSSVHRICSISKSMAHDFLFSPLMRLALMIADCLQTAALVDGVLTTQCTVNNCSAEHSAFLLLALSIRIVCSVCQMAEGE